MASILATAMAVSAIGGLIACGDEESGGPELKVWAPGQSISTYEALAKKFQEENPQYANYNIKFEPVEEGGVQTNMGKDPSTGAAVFFFPSDHLYKLNRSKVLQPLTTEYETIVKGRDVEYAWDFATVEQKIMAFPATNDNGYFLYYDKTFYTNPEDVKSLDTMQAKAKDEEKHISFNYGDVYYSSSFFIGAGVTFDYKDHTMTEYHTTLDSDAGRAATKAYLKYFNPPLNNDYKANNKVITNGDLATGFADGTYVAGVAGTWEWSNIKAAMEKAGKNPDNIATAVLPDFEVDGTTYHMGTFYGAKYCGVNRQKDRDTIVASLALASYFTSKEGQLARYGATYSGPSNIEAATDPTIVADPRLAAYRAQIAQKGYVQHDQSGDFWSPSGFGNLANKIATGSIKDATNPDHNGKTEEECAMMTLVELAASLEKKANS